MLKLVSNSHVKIDDKINISLIDFITGFCNQAPMEI